MQLDLKNYKLALELYKRVRAEKETYWRRCIFKKGELILVHDKREEFSP